MRPASCETREGSPEQLDLPLYTNGTGWLLRLDRILEKIRERESLPLTSKPVRGGGVPWSLREAEPGFSCGQKPLSCSTGGGREKENSLSVGSSIS